MIHFFFGFALLCSMIGYKNSRPFLNQTEVKPNQSWLARTLFSRAWRRLHVLYLLRVLIGSLCFLRLLWFARVITLISIFIR